jgi:hypothetical protein
MASTFPATVAPRDEFGAALADPARAIASPRIDALCFWGAPAIALAFCAAWIMGASFLPHRAGQQATTLLILLGGILTYAHLIAVAPRAYLNKQVFADNRLRLTVMPALLLAGMWLSDTIFVIALVVNVFWDVHHSALQTFGLGRIYDMKAGNDARQLRRIDLMLNWAMYVGPIAFGTCLMAHLATFGRFGELGWTLLTEVPAFASGVIGWIRLAAVSAWLAIVGVAMWEYRRAMRAGYAMPAHKAALFGITGIVSILAWGFAPPALAFIAINIFHAVQYFALVWLKEGKRMQDLLANRPRLARQAVPIFLVLCALFGIGYTLSGPYKALAVPFVACSLLHFWYDSFVWSVRKKQV